MTVAWPGRFGRGDVDPRGASIAVLLAFVLFVLPHLVGADWITTFTSVAIYSVVALGFSVLYGRVGMISLGQIALLVDRLLDRRRGSLRDVACRSRSCSSSSA